MAFLALFIEEKIVFAEKIQALAADIMHIWYKSANFAEVSNLTL